VKLRLLRNIGDDDARRLDLENRMEGETIDAKQPVADELLRRGLATDAATPLRATATPAPAVAVPPGTAPPDFDAMTKEDLQSYADKQGIEGVSLAMRKDDMIAAIEEAQTRPR
jgi:hypothetical protein